jgi:electron transfer flavoprotein beta subunit
MLLKRQILIVLRKILKKKSLLNKYIGELMKILVTVKRVADYEARLKIASDSKSIDTSEINMITNPFDEIAVEEALRLKAKFGGEVIVCSVGNKESQQNIRTALAMGADRGILVTHENNDHFVNTEYTANILENIVREENPDIIIMGKQAIDTDNHQMSEYLAEKLNMGSASQANTVTVNLEEKSVTVIKESEGGLETVSIILPCIISTDLRLNEPRYASLPGIMKAKRKKLAIKDVSEMNIDVQNNVTIIKLETQPERQAGSLLENVDELIDKLTNESKSL